MLRPFGSFPGSIAGTAGSNWGPGGPGPGGNSVASGTLAAGGVDADGRRRQHPLMEVNTLLNPATNHTSVTGEYLEGGQYTGTMVMTNGYPDGSFSK